VEPRKNKPKNVNAERKKKINLPVNKTENSLNSLTSL
jgi:hypothetical protein